jgi:hypothetical protein
MAGLYAALLLSERPGVRVTVFESEARCGGRAKQLRYGGTRRKRHKGHGATRVPGGAGIGRCGTDVHLERLMGRMRVPVRPFPRKVLYFPRGSGAEEAQQLAGMLSKIRRGAARTQETFAQHVRRRLGEQGARRFFALMGYGDDADADAAHTLRHYGFQDNYGFRKRNRGFGVPWDLLVARIVRRLRSRGVSVRTRCRVRAVVGVEGMASRSGRWKVVVAAGGRAPRFDHVLLALPARPAERLLRGCCPEAARMLHDGVRPQSFLYAYAKPASKEAARFIEARVPAYTVLPESPLQKMIPMGNGVYMIAYADNANARRLHGMGCGAIMRLAERALRWEGPGRMLVRCLKRSIHEGTHFFTPRRSQAAPGAAAFVRRLRAELPEGLWIAGELLSLHNQGWVEGALEDAAGQVTRLLNARRLRG